MGGFVLQYEAGSIGSPEFDQKYSRKKKALRAETIVVQHVDTKSP